MSSQYGVSIYNYVIIGHLVVYPHRRVYLRIMFMFYIYCKKGGLKNMENVTTSAPSRVIDPSAYKRTYGVLSRIMRVSPHFPKTLLENRLTKH